jgi:hypothetical protein
VGAAIATSSVRVIVFPLWIWVVQKQLNFCFPYREALMCLLPNVLLAIVLFFMGNQYPNAAGIILVICGAVIIYPVLLIIFRTITEDDLRTARDIATVLPIPYEKIISIISDKVPLRREMP